jgi:hypothetical protein
MKIDVFVILDYLCPKGVPKSDILIHFLSPKMRELGGYAVA